MIAYYRGTMEFERHTVNEEPIAELLGTGIQISDVPDALDLIGNAGAHSVVVREEQLSPEFFRLSSRLAGDILQKFTNYRMRLAIVGDFSKYRSKPLADFIRESNAMGQTIFVPSLEAALERFAKD
jgi:hypothetical protein